MRTGEADSKVPDVTSQSEEHSHHEVCTEACCDPLKDFDIEMLACLAARLAGQNPVRRTTIKLGSVVAFDDLVWRYPDFLARAEAAYRILAAECPPD